jgi:hypothetical protein
MAAILKKLASHFEKGEKNFRWELGLQKTAAVHEAVRAIEASTDNPELIRIK